MPKLKSPSFLKELVQEVTELEEARELLQAVFLERGPYQQNPVSAETWAKVAAYFKFDDGE